MNGDNPTDQLTVSSLKFLRNDSCIVQDCSTGSDLDPAYYITEPITIHWDKGHVTTDRDTSDDRAADRWGTLTSLNHP